jgi:deoxyribodipyrimidine photolyase-related protein
MNQINLVLPNQLFKNSPLFNNNFPFYLVEEYLFFKQYPFHKQKIAFHRATMKRYANFIQEEMNLDVHYIESIDPISDIRLLIAKLKEIGVKHINYIDPVDGWIQKRLNQSCSENKITTKQFPSPLFINTQEDLKNFFTNDKKKYHQTTFYKDQRKKHSILVDFNGKPTGDKWTFDTENRKKYPAKKKPPHIQFPNSDDYFEEAKIYVNNYFSDHFGTLTENPIYPTAFDSTKDWLQQFFEHRFFEFGVYEDAILKENSILNHSVLTPMLNVGLIEPKEIIDECLNYAELHDVPINSTEGFVRQILGWREFIRGVYISKGNEERTKNFWKFKKKIPASFYNGSTGIDPLDDTIKKILKTGYCNHIERLMVLGNFMLLCEFDPDEVYRWFMELFIDAYDWVMVTNVYGMSQFSDGGLMASKPYISGSNYIMKMSNYKKGKWQTTWDGLFWRFMDLHRDFFLSNPRLGMLVRMYDKMPTEKKQKHLEEAGLFLDQLS